MTKVFNNKYEIEKYYDEETNTYIFKEDDKYIDLIVLKFDLDIYCSIIAKNIYAFDIEAFDIKADDITAWNIRARDIKSKDIKADDINAMNIEAENIDYYAVCFAYYNIKCKSIKGRRKNAKHFVLDGTLEVEENVD